MITSMPIVLFLFLRPTNYLKRFSVIGATLKK